MLYTATRKGIVSWDWFGWVKWGKRKWRARKGEGTEGKELEMGNGGKSSAQGVAGNGLGIKEDGTGRRVLHNLEDDSASELNVVSGRET